MAASKNGKKGQDGHQDLGRFVAWCGRERNVVELSPSEVANYAQYMGLGGNDRPITDLARGIRAGQR